MKLIIDASNLRNGGGVTHIVEILNSIEDQNIRFEKVEIFSNLNTLSKIKERPWLEKINFPAINQGLFSILKWRFTYFSKYVNNQKNAVLFNPPGTYIGNFKPFVVMSHNMLIWDKKERRRFGKFSILNLKFLLLNRIQKKSFNKASGILFISKYAQNTILNQLKTKANTIIIHHGINERFIKKPKLEIANCSELLYISNLTHYKHQVILLKASLRLFKEGNKFTLNLVGGYNPDYKKYFDQEFKSHPEYKEFVKYHGKVPFEEIHDFYKNVNGFIFASSCENMPNILIEAMSAGLPILSSNYEPMPEFLGQEHLFYFDPTSVESTYNGLKNFINSKQLATSAQNSYQKSLQYNWEDCAKETFSFLYQTLEKHLHATK